MRVLSDCEGAWLGAMIEAEGCIRDSASPEISMASTEIETIATVLRLTGRGGVGYRPHGGLGKQPQWRWWLTGTIAVARLLGQITPFFTGKRETAEHVLAEAHYV